MKSTPIMKPITLMNILRKYNLEEYSPGIDSGIWETALEDKTKHYIVIDDFTCLYILDVESLEYKEDGVYEAFIFTVQR